MFTARQRGRQGEVVLALLFRSMTSTSCQSAGTGAVAQAVTATTMSAEKVRLVSTFEALRWVGDRRHLAYHERTRRSTSEGTGRPRRRLMPPPGRVGITNQVWRAAKSVCFPGLLLPVGRQERLDAELPQLLAALAEVALQAGDDPGREIDAACFGVVALGRRAAQPGVVQVLLDHQRRRILRTAPRSSV